MLPCTGTLPSRDQVLQFAASFGNGGAGSNPSWQPLPDAIRHLLSSVLFSESVGFKLFGLPRKGWILIQGLGQALAS